MVIVSGHGVIAADVTTWALVQLILGVILVLTGRGLLAEMTSARWKAAFFVPINAIAQVVPFPAAPLWAFLMIILDVAVIYQLTARWAE